MNLAKSIAALAAVFGFCVTPASAADLQAAEAAEHIGETATVCGVMASGKYDADMKSQPTFLDFEKPVSRPGIYSRHLWFGSEKFATPETSLRGKRICVTGKIQDRSGLPQIILNDPKQLSQ